jgi:hypothetical protein
MFPDDADSLRATARRLRAIAAGCFDWRHQGTETETQIVDMHEREARKQMLAIAQGFDRLAERIEQRTASAGKPPTCLSPEMGGICAREVNPSVAWGAV